MLFFTILFARMIAMKLTRYLFCASLVALSMIICASHLQAAPKVKLKTRSPIDSGVQAPSKTPDLVIDKVRWSTPPKEGRMVGHSSILNIIVKNSGNDTARANKMKVKCTPLSASSCPSSLDGNPDIPMLGSGQSAAVAWPPLSSEKWLSGRFRLCFHADSKNSVKESNERNNNKCLVFSVAPKPKIKAKMPSQNIRLAPPSNKITMIEKPDIIVTEVTPVSSELKAGDPVSFKVTFKNRGGAVSQRSEGNISYQTYYGSAQFHAAVKTELPILSPGQSKTVVSEQGILADSHGNPAGGEFTLWAEADTVHRIDELSETNNKLKGAMTVQRRTDLYMTDIIADNSSEPGNLFKRDRISVPSGSRVYFEFLAHGCDGFLTSRLSNPGKVVIKTTGFADAVVPKQAIKLNRDAVKTGFVFQCVRTWTTPGEKRLTVHLDADNQIEESKEFNNTGLFIVDVY
jgi:subtilase family serine protease